MKNILTILLLLPFFIVDLYAAKSGDVIANQATITFSIDNENRTILTNEVKLTVAKTPAIIEFLAIDPDGSEDILKDTSYLKDGSKVEMPKAELPDGQEIEIPSIVKLSKAYVYAQKDLVIVRVTDLDQNIDANGIDEILIDVVNPRTNELEKLYLQETTVNSGVFIGYFYVEHCENSQEIEDGSICINGGDNIGAKYYDESSFVKVEAKAVVLDKKETIFATKSQNKDIAAIGEYVKYNLKFENIGNRDYPNLEIIDNLPIGLKYVKNSFKINGVLVKPKLSKDGLTISYLYANLAKNSAVNVSYTTVVGANAKNSLINTTYAKVNGNIASNIAKSILEIKRDLDYSKGYIYGQVYLVNNNCENNNTKACGIANLRLYMEDGRFATTDKRGRYHFVDIKNGTHIVAIDTQTLSAKYRVALCNNSTKFANRGNSQFVDVFKGGLYRADFCLEKLNNKKEYIESNKQNNIKKVIKNSSFLKDSNKLFSIKLIKKSSKVVTLKFKAYKKGSINFYISDGLYYLKDSIDKSFTPKIDKEFLKLSVKEKTEGSFDVALKNSSVYEKEILAIFSSNNRRSETLRLGFDSANEAVACLTNSDAETSYSKVVESNKKFYYSKDDVDNLGKEARIVYPPKNWVPSIPSTRVAILYPKGGSVELTLNGNKVSMLNYEGVFRGKKNSMYLMHYKGVDLKEGANEFVAVIKNRDKKIVAVSKRNIYVESHAPSKIEFLANKSKLVANGVDDVVIAFKLIGESGHPLRGGLVGSFDCDNKHEPKDIVNGKGQYSVDKNGITYLRLKPTVNAGETKIIFTLFNGEKEEFKLYLKPDIKEWIVVGFAEGTIGYKKLNGNIKSIQASKEKEGLYVDGRLAFFARGQIKGEYLLTIAYDSGRKESERALFDEIDKDKYYTVYADSSTQGNEAPSTKKLYIKLEKERFSALFGDFNTNIKGGEFNSYNRDYTGFSARYVGKNISLITFIAKNSKVHKYKTIKPDGTSGDYKVDSADIIKGTLKVKIVTRDKDHLENVINEKSLEAWSDYSIDYDMGTIRFYKPIFSTDEKFNPNFIEVEYDIEGNSASKYTYGARVEYKNSNKFKVGINAIKQNKGINKSSLVGIDLEAKIAKSINLKAEYAVSKNRDLKSSNRGVATKVELEYIDINSSVKVYYRKQDSNFGIENLSKVTSNIRKYGFEYSRNLNKKFSIYTQAYRESLIDANKSSSTTMAELSLKYTDINKSAKIGFRHIKSTDKKAQNQILLEASKYLLDRRLKVAFLHEQSLNSKNSKSNILLDYKVNDKLSLIAKIERTKEQESKIYSSFGLTYNPWEGGEFKLLKIYNKNSNDSNGFNTISLKQEYNFNKFWRGYIGFERGFGDYKESYSTYILGVAYNNKKVDAKAYIEYKDGSNQKKLNADFNFYVKKSRDLALGFSSSYKYFKDDNLKQRDTNAKLSLVYRVDKKLLILDKLEFKDSKTVNSGESIHTTKFINSLHLNYNYNDKLEFGLWYGLKYTLDILDSQKNSSWIDMLGIDTLYRVNDKLSLGAQLALLHCYGANNLEYSYGLFIEKTLWDNAVIRLGVNINGFSDSDLDTQNYRSKGIYLQFRMKFDNKDIKKLLKGAQQ